MGVLLGFSTFMFVFLEPEEREGRQNAIEDARFHAVASSCSSCCFMGFGAFWFALFAVTSMNFDNADFPNINSGSLGYVHGGFNFLMFLATVTYYMRYRDSVYVSTKWQTPLEDEIGYYQDADEEFVPAHQA